MENIRIQFDQLVKLTPSIKSVKQKGIHSRLQETTKIACDYFREKKFGMYIGYIKKIGCDEALVRIANQKEQGIRNPSFFFKKLK